MSLECSGGCFDEVGDGRGGGEEGLVGGGKGCSRRGVSNRAARAKVGGRRSDMCFRLGVLRTF